MSQPRTSGFSPRVLNRIEDAGASAYAWHDQELTAFLDPSRLWTRLSWLLGTLALWASLALMVVLGWATAWWVGVSVLLLLLGGLLRRGFAAVPGLAMVAVGLVAAVSDGPWVVGAVVAAMSLVMGLICYRWRPVTAGIVTVTVLLAGALDARLPVTLAAVVVGTLIAIAVGALGGRNISLPVGRVNKAMVNRTIPPPPSRVPWLVRLVKRSRMREVPPEVEKKKAGAYGERRTALLLLGLKPRQGTRIFNDVRIPGADTANADHVVLARSGLYVIDTKQFGSRHDPGQVVLDADRGDIVHRTAAKTMPLSKSMQTVTWAARAISNVAGIQATPMLTIHNAAVAGGLRAMMPDGLLLDVVSSNDLIARIEQAPPVFSIKELASLARNLTHLETATGDGAARPVSPIGLAATAAHLRGSWSPAAAEAAVMPQGERTAPPARTEAPPAPSVTPGPTPTPGTPPAPGGASPGTDGSRTHAPAAPAQSQAARDMQTPILERWASMRDSEPAAPDEIPDDLRSLGFGTPVYVITFGDGDVKSEQAVAMSGVCRGAKGVTYAWVCSTTDWAIHQASGQPVYVNTVHAQQIMLREPKEGVR